jgi:hypothetical protein
MYIDWFTFSILLILIALAFLVRFILSKRYGQSLANKLVIGIFGISFLIGFITFKIISRDIDDQAFPATEWKQYMKLPQSVKKLEYRPDLGLFAIQETAEVQITDENPFCVSEGQLANLKPREIQTSDSQLSELSPPPQSAVHQIDFILSYPIDADEIGFSSFATFENGEIWCTERYMRGGPGGFVAIGLLGFVYFVISALVFLGSLVLSVVIAVISLEIYRRRNENGSE